jgi:predicted DCC family thiol-disulfide oxidoreductase YuxK
MPGDAVLLYDGECGLCRWSAAKVLQWDRGRRLRPVALQDAEADRLLGHLTPEGRMDSWHLVTSDGTVVSAGAAAAPLLRLLPGGGPLATLAAAAPGPTERAYRLVADNRSPLGRLIGSGAARRARRVIAERSRPAAASEPDVRAAG